MTQHANDSGDPILAIVASGREITAADVELVWADFIDGRCSWQKTADRAQALVETVNVPSHVANGALVDLVHLRLPGANRDVNSHRATRERWRAVVKQYDADPLEWERPLYQDMLRRRASIHGTQNARDLSVLLIRHGRMRQRDADAVLDDLTYTGW